MEVMGRGEVWCHFYIYLLVLQVQSHVVNEDGLNIKSVLLPIVGANI